MKQKSVQINFKKRFENNTNLPKLPQTEFIKKKEVIQKKYEYNGSILPLYKLTVTTCPLCKKSYSYVTDYHRGEKVCKYCGLVITENITNFNQPTYIKHYQNRKLSKFDKQYLKKTHHNHMLSNKKIWIQQQLTNKIEILTSQELLNNYQKETVKHILRKVPLKKLHGTLTSEKIIICVIRYVLKKTYNYQYLKYNHGIFKEITSHEYNIVEKNIQKYYEKKRNGKKK